MFTCSTQVKIDLKVLRLTVEELSQEYLKVNTRETSIGRSRFSAWNNLNHFRQQVDNGGDYAIIDVNGAAKGKSARVYYTPSVTSLAKPVRKAIVPLNPGNKFVYFDIKAAEFFMNCYFCNETKALQAYAAGQDIYLAYADLFPKNTPRKVIKEALIANMYGMTAYTLAQRCGITEAQADRILRTIGTSFPSMESAKRRRIYQARTTGYYWCRNGFANEEVAVAPFQPDEFKPNLALSAYVQSALGMFMQSRIMAFAASKGTLLTVFDSMLIECHPDNILGLKNYIPNLIAPFRAGEINVGDTFYEAAYPLPKQSSY